jgi:hypothetical protein
MIEMGEIGGDGRGGEGAGEGRGKVVGEGGRGRERFGGETEGLMSVPLCPFPPLYLCHPLPSSSPRLSSVPLPPSLVYHLSPIAPISLPCLSRLKSPLVLSLPLPLLLSPSTQNMACHVLTRSMFPYLSSSNPPPPQTHPGYNAPAKASDGL